MPQDTIIEVLRTEEKMNQIREQTAADCRQKLLMAQRSADRLREQARADAEAEVREMMSEAERQAAQDTYHALRKPPCNGDIKKRKPGSASRRLPGGSWKRLWNANGYCCYASLAAHRAAK